MEFESGIPCIDFSKNPEDLVEGSEGWKNLCGKVREACEGYGCFEVVYDKVPIQLHEEMVMASKDLFDLPVETKQKNSNSNIKYAYIPKTDFLPLYESSGFKLDPANNLDQPRTFTDLMWPNGGNPSFCQTVDNIGKMMIELERIVRKMVFESYGVEKYYDSNIEDSEDVLRIMTYDAPPSNVDSAIGIIPHTDKSIQAVIYQDIQGFEVLPKEGDDWIQVMKREATFIVLVGEAFKAWSNGRVHAPKHRVMMRGEKARYAYALYALAKEGVTLEVPKEFIDN